MLHASQTFIKDMLPGFVFLSSFIGVTLLLVIFCGGWVRIFLLTISFVVLFTSDDNSSFLSFELIILLFAISVIYALID